MNVAAYEAAQARRRTAHTELERLLIELVLDGDARDRLREAIDRDRLASLQVLEARLS